MRQFCAACQQRVSQRSVAARCLIAAPRLFSNRTMYTLEQCIHCAARHKFMPLLHPSAYLAQQLFAFLDQHESSPRSQCTDSDLAAALYSWGGARLQPPQRNAPGPLQPIPFGLVKQLHRALATGSPVQLPPPLLKRRFNELHSLSNRRPVVARACGS
jgi:hypothetical protein